MHVGLNCVFLVPGETGGPEIYARELAAALAASRGVRVTAFVSRDGEHASFADAVSRVVLPMRARRRPEWVAAEQLLLPRAAARAGVDVLHSLNATAPALGPRPRIVTIHDLHHRLAPEAHLGLRGLGMRPLVAVAARRAHRVITLTEVVRDQLVEHLDVSPDRIEVVPPGPGRSSVPDPASAERVRGALGLPADRRILLTLAAKRPHKNLGTLLAALARIDPPARPVTVLAGYATDHQDELHRTATHLGVDRDVRICGWLPDALVDGLFALTEALVLPTRAEGFGLPVVEAMLRGVPVVCSAHPVLAEVSGDAAMTFDPHDPSALAQAIESLLADPALRETLIAAGRRRAGALSWHRAAAMTLDAYERAGARAGEAKVGP